MENMLVEFLNNLGTSESCDGFFQIGNMVKSVLSRLDLMTFGAPIL